MYTNRKKQLRLELKLELKFELKRELKPELKLEFIQKKNKQKREITVKLKIAKSKLEKLKKSHSKDHDVKSQSKII